MPYPGPSHDFLAKELRRAREDFGLSQRGLARKLGRGQSYICKVETGRQAIFAWELVEWCEAVGIRVSELFIRMEGSF